MIPWALIWPSVWALVAGALVMALANSIASYALIPGYVNHRLMFNREAFQSLFRYGRWILLSTGLSFLLSQGDRAFLGKVLSSEQLGIYSIAVVFAEGLQGPIVALAGSILQPLYAKLAERGSDELRRKTFQTRALLLAATVPGAWVFAIFGQQIIQFLYDARYWDAGWMLRILAVGIIGSILGATSDRALLAVGDSRSYLILQIARSILLIIGMAVGIAVSGLPGLLIGLSCARLLEYIPLAYFLRRHGVWLPQLDLTVLGVSAGVIVSGVWVVGW
jgi:O-antigen/teichoic acid export membrane protein